MSSCGRVAFFVLWACLCVIGAVLLLLNVRWTYLTNEEMFGAVVVLVVIIILHIGVMESLAVSIMAVLYCGNPVQEERGDSSRLKLILNYNLLALDANDVDEGMGRMFDAYMGNLSSNISAVYLSATQDSELVKYETLIREKYRARIVNELLTEGRAYCEGKYMDVDHFRRVRVWLALEHQHGKQHILDNLSQICTKFAGEFMVIHRVSRVLRKCGQYQDLMLLSAGRFMAYTYTDPAYYGPHARPYGAPMFHDSEDVRNIHDRHFDYTFVLDCDSRVPVGMAHSLLEVAAAKPDKGILQPVIRFEAGIWDTIYMNLEDLRQRLGDPITIAMAKCFGQCGFYGKALINNRIYIDNVIGTPDNLIEKVPVDVLSHDTYEAAILKPYHVGSIALIERPTYNYLSWNSRQRRWNLGDIIITMYLYPRLLEGLVRTLQKCFNKKAFAVKVRTQVKLDYITNYIANSSTRSMFTKPFWLLLVLIHGFLPIPTYYPLLPVFVVLVIVCLVSKLAILMRCQMGVLYLIPELISSVFQYTPEVIAGFVRFIRVLAALVRGNHKWVPQRHIEESFNTTNPWKIFIYSYKHLWGYAFFALVITMWLLLFDYVFHIFLLDSSVPMILVYFDIACVFLLPMYCFITSLRICPCCRRKQEPYSDIESVSDSMSSGENIYAEITSSKKRLLLQEDTSLGFFNSARVLFRQVGSSATGEDTLLSRFQTNAKVLFRQLKQYAAEKQADLFGAKKTKVSDSFEFRIHPRDVRQNVPTVVLQPESLISQQNYVTTQNDQFKVTAVQPGGHLVFIDDKIIDSTWTKNTNNTVNIDLTTSSLKPTHMERSEVIIPIEANTKTSKSKVHNAKYTHKLRFHGSLDSVEPLHQFPDTGRVFNTYRAARRDRHRVAPGTFRQPPARLFIPQQGDYTDIHDTNINSTRSLLITSDDDLAPFQQTSNSGGPYVVRNIKKSDDALQKSTSLFEIHQFRSSMSLDGPPVPPKRMPLLDGSFRRSGEVKDVELSLKVTSPQSEVINAMYNPDKRHVKYWKQHVQGGHLMNSTSSIHGNAVYGSQQQLHSATVHSPSHNNSNMNASPVAKITQRHNSRSVGARHTISQQDLSSHKYMHTALYDPDQEQVQYKIDRINDGPRGRTLRRSISDHDLKGKDTWENMFLRSPTSNGKQKITTAENMGGSLENITINENDITNKHTREEGKYHSIEQFTAPTMPHGSRQAMTNAISRSNVDLTNIGLQGTIVKYDTRRDATDKQKQWHYSEKIIKVDKPQLAKENDNYAITFQPRSKFGEAEATTSSRVLPQSGFTSGVDERRESDADHSRRVVSGVNIDRWLQLDIVDDEAPLHPKASSKKHFHAAKRHGNNVTSRSGKSTVVDVIREA